MKAWCDGSLPIDAHLDEALEHLEAHPSLVVEAPTGSGKTTRLPLALLEAPWARDGRILVLEPRRVAARTAARRMAATWGEPPGDTVGWHIRFERRAGPKTRLLVLTEGLLVRWLQDDPFLEGVSAVVLDEFHERSLDADLALAMLLRIQREVRPSLRLVVMSATLDGERVATHLDNAPRLRSDGRLHPVEIRHLTSTRRSPLEDEVREAADRLLDILPGDVLTFLPGVGEIRQVESALQGWAHGRDVELVPLYGDLSPAAQERALQPGSRRRVVLATNVAETSVTLPNVTGVIDSGLVRRMLHDPGLGLDRLTLGRVSVASADQRAGRAGRVQPGVCVRLWTAKDESRMDPTEIPEIHRRELAGTWLQLLAWGERDPTSLPWLDPPTTEAAEQATALLTTLRAIEDGGALTDRGRAMAALPLPPRLAAAVHAAEGLGVVRSMITLAALLEERDLPGLTSGGRGPTDSDAIDRLETLEAARARGIRDGRLRPIERVEDALERQLKPTPGSLANEGEPKLRRKALGEALLAGWPDRVAMRRTQDPRLARMVGGHGLRLGPRSRLQDTWLWIAMDVQGAGRAEAESTVHMASAIEEDWLAPWGRRREIHLRWDAHRERVIARRRTMYEDLVLQEQPASIEDPMAAAALLQEAILEDVSTRLALHEEPVRTLLRRLELLRRTFPEESDLPRLNATWWKAHLPSVCGTDHDLATVRNRLAERLQGVLGWSLLQRLDREFPLRLTLSNGRQAKVQWPPTGPPVIAMRMQDLFGVPTTPTVAQGRVQVQLHLLAPNGRPQQITTDLENFWRSTWVEVRKELRARYPKHAWPEDPKGARPPAPRGKRASS